MSQASPIEAELAVIGAGAAGLYVALEAATAGARVALISATSLAQTASYWAQGGLAAALAPGDSPQLHQSDTERAGRALVRPSAAAVLCGEAPERVHDLERLGVNFDTDRGGALSLGLEGGHSRRRVVHSGGSATGRRVVRQLSALAAQQPLIEVLEQARADALLTGADGRVVGLGCEDGRSVRARAVVICAGGAAALWARTTNPPGSLGTGMLLAHRAGAGLADLEFLQFHPTAVIGVPGREGFLVTELAPRDEVSAAIQSLLDRTGQTAVSLDMREVDPTLFPNVVDALAEAGIDVTRELIPVAPAAHFMMGGITTDLHARSTLTGLYAVGESACTGLHGANRLASNSLSECFVFGARAARAALAEPAVERSAVATAVELHATVAPSTRTALWRHAGLHRDAEGLGLLLEDPYPLARLIAACALAREESRGAHHRDDHPQTEPALDATHTIVEADGSVRFERWD
jgi:L-aspartate oxidase